MANSILRVRSFAIAGALMAIFLLIFTAPTAFADPVEAGAADGLQGSSPGELRENSWRYENGYPKEVVVEAASDSDGVTVQDTYAATSTQSMTRQGIDVSQWNGDINWSKVSKVVEFAIIRCGYGENVSKQDDTRWLENVKACKEAGLPMGVYIYSYAKTASAGKSEANHVIRCLEEAGLDATTLKLPIYLDMEDETTANIGKSKQQEVFDQFRKTLIANGYSNIGIYSSSSWWDSKLSTITLDGDLRWIASWGVSSPYANYPDIAENGCGLWQYSSDGSVSGISGRVDMNFARDDWPFLEEKPIESVTMFRLYNPYTGEHLYTSDTKEAAKITKYGWVDEGIAWTTPEKSEIPVYRLYNKHVKGGDHHYTTSKEEYDDLKDEGWKGEGVAWYSAASDQVPIYRVYNPNAYSTGGSGAHHYTKSEKERDKLVKRGWKNEKIAWYGLK